MNRSKVLIFPTLISLLVFSACGKSRSAVDARMDPGETSVAEDIVVSSKTYDERVEILTDLLDREILSARGGRLKRLRFFKQITPAVIESMLEVDAERKKVFEYESDVITGEKIPEELRISIENLLTRYKARSIEDLKNRVDFVPIDMLFTQAAVESSSGQSAVARDCNNLFGVHASSAAQSCPGHPILNRYPNFSGSIKRYVHLLNTGSAYKAFRTSRRKIRDSAGESAVLDSSVLIQGLLSYSERGQDYVNSIASLISADRLDALYAEFISRVH